MKPSSIATTATFIVTTIANADTSFGGATGNQIDAQQDLLPLSFDGSDADAEKIKDFLGSMPEDFPWEMEVEAQAHGPQETAEYIGYKGVVNSMGTPKTWEKLPKWASITNANLMIATMLQMEREKPTRMLENGCKPRN